MEDYGTVKVETILDIMKVMNYAMQQGKVCFFFGRLNEKFYGEYVRLQYIVMLVLVEQDLLFVRILYMNIV
jgi:hypothetical protein